MSCATFDPDLLTGWGHRQSNWEFSIGVQHEIVPRVSVDFGYSRRVWKNFQVTDNLALGANDFDTFSITAPKHPELPNGGGYVLDVQVSGTLQSIPGPEIQARPAGDGALRVAAHSQGVRRAMHPERVVLRRGVGRP